MSEQDDKIKAKIENLKEEPRRRDLQIAELTRSLEKEKDSRLEERFIWVFLFAIVFDVVAIGLVKSYLLFFPFFLELAFLIWLAKRLGIDEVAVLLARIWTLMERWMERRNNTSNS